MRITRLGGIATQTTFGPGDTLASPEKVECLFYAGSAISLVGQAVSLDPITEAVTDGHTTTATRYNTLGRRVIATTTALIDKQLVCGIYEGQGGTGAPNTTATMIGNSGTFGGAAGALAPGRAAVANDIIWVTVYGGAIANVANTAGAVLRGSSLHAATSNTGVLVLSPLVASVANTDLVYLATSYFRALEPNNTAVSATGVLTMTRIWVNCM